MTAIYSGAGSQDLREISDIIVADLKKNPEECYIILNMIRDNNLGEKGSGRLFLLLEKTGHIAAQKVLLAILESPADYTRLAVIQAAGAMIGIENISISLFLVMRSQLTIKGLEFLKYYAIFCIKCALIKKYIIYGIRYALFNTW